ncbi:PAS domain-containing protein [Roseicella frigidaeris]|nr:PAS domain-containing protein [Roseicella frigidaeris]
MRGMLRRRWRLTRAGLRAHLLALVLAALVPALAVGTMAAWIAVEGEEAAEVMRLHDAAWAFSLAIDRELGTQIAALEAFAAAPALRAGPPPGTLPAGALPAGGLAELDAYARRLARQIGIPVSLVRPDGQALINTALAPEETPSRVSRPAFVAEVLAAGRPLVSDLITNPATGRQVFSVGVPVRNAAGEAVMVLCAASPLARMQRLLASQYLGEAAYAAISDAGGRIIARSDARHGQMVGRTLPPANQAQFVNHREGRFRGISLMGIDTVYAFHGLAAAPGWTVFVGEPAAAIEAARRGPLLALAAGGLLALALGGSLALLQARRILRPLARLHDHALALSADRAHPDPARLPPLPVAELEALRRGFAAAEGALHQRAAAERRALAGLNAIYAAVPVGLALLDRECRYRSLNNALAEMHELPVALHLGRHVAEVAPALWPQVEPYYRTVLETGEPVLDRLVRGAPRPLAEPRERLVSYAPVRDEAGEIWGVSIVAYDVTEQRRAAADLAASEERFRLLVEGVTDHALLMLDAEGRVASWNTGAERVKGWPMQEAIGQPYALFFTAEDRAAGLPASILADARRHGVYRGEGWRLRRDGSRFRAAVTITALCDEAGRLRGFAKVSRDVTERRREEEMRSLLAREVDHRAKNVLAVALSLLRLTPRADAAQFAASVEGRIAAMARAHSVLATGGWRGAELRGLAEGELAAHAGQVSLAGPRLGLSPDAVQPVAMLLHELATNAAKYGALSRAGGQVALRWEHDAEGGLRLDWQERGGPAVAAPGGRRGFGSRLVATLVGQQLGGQITFDWQPEGMCCRITLPPWRLQAEPPAPQPAGPVPIPA